MDIISYIHKSVELLFQILGLVEVWTHTSMELSPKMQRGSSSMIFAEISRCMMQRRTNSLCWIMLRKVKFGSGESSQKSFGRLPRPWKEKISIQFWKSSLKTLPAYTLFYSSLHKAAKSQTSNSNNSAKLKPQKTKKYFSVWIRGPGPLVKKKRGKKNSHYYLTV